MVHSSADIRACPKQGCGYAGFINLDESCNEDLICLLCKTQWRDPLHYTSLEKLVRGVKDVFLMRSDILSQVMKLLTTEPCPNENCGFLIQKNGGCNHMRCENCKHEFCWMCLGEYYGYKHSLADNGAVCGLRALIGSIFIVICGFSVYLKFMLCLNATFIWPFVMNFVWFIWHILKYTCFAAAAYGIDWIFRLTLRSTHSLHQF